MDGAAEYDDVLTLASTNDPESLDSAATRAARFDSIIHLGYPNRAACALILERYLASLPQKAAVDPVAVAAVLPADISGADLREMVRRAVLEHYPDLTTTKMQSVVTSGRWRPEPLHGNYL